MHPAKRLLTILLGSVAAFASSAPASVASSYTITDLGTIGGSASFTFGMNESGWVVGHSTPISEGSEFETLQAFLYDGTGMKNLGLGDHSYASDVNDRGQVVGSIFIGPSGDNRGFLLDGSGVREVGTLGGSSSSIATDINNAGQVVGGSGGHAFLYDDRGIHDLGPGHATAINEAGQIVGNPYRPTLGGFYATAHDINDLGQVVGTSEPSGSYLYHAFVNDGIRMHDLGLGYAQGINNLGQVVGSRQPSGGPTFLWKDGVMTDLESLIPADSGWRLYVARDINDRGEIVGWGRHHGEFRSFLLSPERPNAPVTSARASTSSGAYAFPAWTNDDVTVELAATGSNGARIRSITYSTWGVEVTGAKTVKHASASLTIRAEGWTTAGYHAVDKNGNVETTKSLTVKIDKTAPLVRAVNPKFARLSQIEPGATPTQIPFRVNPSGTDWNYLSGIARYQVQLSSDGSGYADITNSPFWLQQGRRYQIRARAQDRAGNWSDWTTTRSFTISTYQDTDAEIAYSGDWESAAASDAYGGSVRSAGSSGDRAALTFRGRGVGWVATRDRDRGQAAVYVDGSRVRTIDLWARSRVPRQVVFSLRGLSASTSHTIEVHVLGAKRARSTGTAVDLDSFLVFG